MPSAFRILNPLGESSVTYHYVELAGVENPGLAKLSGFDRPFGWDVKKGKGTKGATITLNEYPPAKGSVTVYLWADDHFDAINEWIAPFQYDSSKKPGGAVDVWHPSLASVGIDSVVCEKISPLKHEGKDLWSITLDLIEYWPPPKGDSSKTPNGSKFSSAEHVPVGGQVDPVADAKQKQIQNLLAEARKP